MKYYGFCTFLVVLPIQLLSQVLPPEPSFKEELARNILEQTVGQSGIDIVKKSYDEAKQAQLKLGTEATLSDFLPLYKERWKQVLKAFDWEEFKKNVQENLGISSAGMIDEVRALPVRAANGQPRVSQLEAQFLSKRKQQAQAQVKSIITEGTALSPYLSWPTCTIGIAVSGGAYVGMLSSAGYLQGLSSIGVLDASTYLAASSAASWTVGGWLGQQKKYGESYDINSFAAFLNQKINENRLNWFGISSTQSAQDFNLKIFMETVIWPKIVFGKMISSIDLVGGLLTNFLFKDFGDRMHRQTLSDLWYTVESGTSPWPLFTAITLEGGSTKDEYQLYEFDPAFIRNDVFNLGIQSFAFDKHFVGGKTIYEETKQQRLARTRDLSPEPSLGFMLALFGSKYTANWNDIKRLALGQQGTSAAVSKSYNKKQKEIDKEVQKIDGLMDQLLSDESTSSKIRKLIQKNLDDVKAALLIKSIDGMMVDRELTIAGRTFAVGGSMRLSPAQICNPFYQCNMPVCAPVDALTKSAEFLTFCDAALLYDVPLMPLLQPERAVDLIILCDPYEGEVNISFALEHIQKMQGTTYGVKQQTKEWTLYEAEPINEQLVRRAYPVPSAPLILRIHPSKEYTGVATDVVQNEIQNITSILPFSVSAEQARNLLDGAKERIEQHETAIKDIIKTIVYKKRNSEAGKNGSKATGWGT